MTRTLTVWVGILAIAFANGALRELVLVPRFGAMRGGQISVVILSGAVAGVTWYAIGWLRPITAADALRIGATWAALTLAFEFGAGHYLFAKPWDLLLADYRIWEGRLWIVVLLTTLLAPLGTWYVRLSSAAV